MPRLEPVYFGGTPEAVIIGSKTTALGTLNSPMVTGERGERLGVVRGAPCTIAELNPLLELRRPPESLG